MKKIYLLLLLISLLSIQSISQTLFVPNYPTTDIASSPNSNVGIGHGNPDMKLDVRTNDVYISRFQHIGNSQISGIRIGRPNSFGDLVITPAGFGFGVASLGADLPMNSQNLNDINFFISKTNGNIGIGTSTPTARLSLHSESSSLSDVIGIGAGNALKQWAISYDQDSWLQSKLSFDEFENNGVRHPRLTIKAGNVGIGTTMPTARLSLHSENSSLTDIIGIGAGTALKQWAISYDQDSWLQSKLSFDEFESNGIRHPRLTIKAGNIGVGHDSPDMKLDVRTNNAFISRFQHSGGSQISGIRIGRFNSFSDLIITPTGFGIGVASLGSDLPMNSQSLNDISFFISKTNGNIGIGTTSPDSDAVLTVKGSIHSTEIKVLANAGGVPDYVFDKNYKLPSLKETKEYISKNNHLPEIPSAAEIEENGGFNLGEMNMKLLKKIEEMTLHQIHMMEEIQALKKEVNTLKGK